MGLPAGQVGTMTSAAERIARRTRVFEDISPDAIPYDRLMAEQQPTILKDVAREWPLVRAGQQSARDAIDYLRGFDAGRPVVGAIGSPEIAGRFFYDDSATALNFEARRAPLASLLDQLAAHLEESAPPGIYIGSTDLDDYLTGFRGQNDLVLNHPMFEADPPLASIWIGNRTTATAHYDMS